MTDVSSALSVVPANEASWNDLQTLFGSRGAAAGCQCQRYKLRPREAFRSFPVEERAHRLCQQTRCGDPESGHTSGLVAYLHGDPVGWCAVEPRNLYEGLVRSARVPWEGREEDKTDAGIWAVTCLFTRIGFRKPRRRTGARANVLLRRARHAPGVAAGADAAGAASGGEARRAGLKVKPMTVELARRDIIGREGGAGATYGLVAAPLLERTSRIGADRVRAGGIDFSAVSDEMETARTIGVDPGPPGGVVAVRLRRDRRARFLSRASRTDPTQRRARRR